MDKCGNCIMFHCKEDTTNTGSCDLVSGSIDPEYVCDYYEPDPEESND